MEWMYRGINIYTDIPNNYQNIYTLVQEDTLYNKKYSECYKQYKVYPMTDKIYPKYKSPIVGILKTKFKN